MLGGGDGGGGGDSAVLASAAPPTFAVDNSNSNNSAEMAAEEDESTNHHGGGGNGGGGNRWPRHETLELLRIRSEMDSIFRDSTPKAPLWEEVSRKLGELGYKRSAKKCKEKFENVYKYHKRTKDGRTAKHDGKSYRFFQELEAFDGGHQQPPPRPPLPALPWATTTTAANSHQIMSTIPPSVATSFNFSITPPHHSQTNLSPTAVTPAEPISSSQPLNPSPQSVFHPSYRHHTVSATAHLFSSSTSSSTASDEEMEQKGTTKSRKRKLREFLHRLTKDVIRKQEELQKKFLETVEKLDRERLDRESAWRNQEMNRINREHEILIQERSTAAAKDAAVLALIQKVSGNGGAAAGAGSLIAPLPQLSFPRIEINAEAPTTAVTSSTVTVSVAGGAHVVPSPPQLSIPTRIQINGEAHPPPPTAAMAISGGGGAGVVASPPQLSLQFSPRPAKVPKTATMAADSAAAAAAASSRWPKTEVHALIGLRTRLDEKYQENGPKGPLWEEISSEMKKLGYNRSSKRCKEKWENINKYFKKVKESSRKRTEDSKTCPYFHQLDALYREKSKVIDPPPPPPNGGGGVGGGYISVNPISVVEPSPPPHATVQHWPLSREEEEDDEDDYEDEETDEDDGGGGGRGGGVRGFEIVQNKPPAMAVGGNGE
ncbi:Trihelix transcription factor GT-2 [Linum perenne]